MRTIEIKLYKFNELSEEAKKNAIEKLHDINVNSSFWHECIVDMFKEDTQKFEVEKVYFSGFWSQGDGAMFEYSGISQELFEEAIDSLKIDNYKKNAMKKAGIFSVKGKQQGCYYHEKSCNHIMYFENNDVLHENIDSLFYEFHSELEDFIEDKYIELARELYNKLENEYEYQTSEEAIIETIECNDYEFTEEGEIY